MIYEDGKYYPMMKAVPGKREQFPYTEEEYEYGRVLLKEKHPVLHDFLKREIRIRTNILENLRKSQDPSESSKARIIEIEKKLKQLYAAEGRYR